MKLYGFLIDEHLCVDFAFRDTVDSFCRFWRYGQTIKEFLIARITFFKSVSFFFRFTLACEMVNSGLYLCDVFFHSIYTAYRLRVSGHYQVPVGIFLTCLLWLLLTWFLLWSLRLSRLKFMKIFCLRCLVHFLHLCVRNFIALYYFDAFV